FENCRTSDHPGGPGVRILKDEYALDDRRASWTAPRFAQKATGRSLPPAEIVASRREYPPSRANACRYDKLRRDNRVKSSIPHQSASRLSLPSDQDATGRTLGQEELEF